MRTRWNKREKLGICKQIFSTQLQKTEHSISPLSFYMPMPLPLPLGMLLHVVPQGFSHIPSTPLKKSKLFGGYRVMPTLSFFVPFKLYDWLSTRINQFSSNENKLIVCFSEHDVGPNEGQHEQTRISVFHTYHVAILGSQVLIMWKVFLRKMGISSFGGAVLTVIFRGGRLWSNQIIK